MTYLIASIVGEAVVFIGALYYACTLHGVGWCPRFLLACFALSTMYDLILSCLQLVFEARQRKLARLLTAIGAVLTTLLGLFWATLK